jgi:RNA polymerase sigma-70 factor (ECF subfamily)
MPEPEEDRTSRFMSLLIQNQRCIQAYISYLALNRSDCEDILQDTLSEMWNKFDQYEEGTNFRVWGITIARFKVFSHQRKYQKTKLHFNSDTITLLERQAQDDFEKEYMEEQKEILQHCLEKLSSREKEYLGFRYEQQLTFQGIAERFGISMQGAYKAISIIHARLLKCVHSGMQREGLL